MACPHPETQQVGGSCYYCTKVAGGLMGGRAHPEDLTPDQRIFVGFESPTFGPTESRNGWKPATGAFLDTWAGPPERWEVSIADKAFLQWLMTSEAAASITEDLERKRGGQRSWA